MLRKVLFVLDKLASAERRVGSERSASMKSVIRIGSEGMERLRKADVAYRRSS